MEIRRGDILWVEFHSGNGHVQRGRRPCVVVSTNRVNSYARVINVVPGTTNLERKNNPVHLIIKNIDVNGYMGKDTMFLIEQITAIDTDQVLGKAGFVNANTLETIIELIKKQLGIGKEQVDEQTKQK